QHWDALHNMTVIAEMQATEFKTAEGFEKDSPTFHGAIIIRKPDTLRVRGTYFGVMAFDMASDGSQFTLVIPSKNEAIEGANTVEEKSSNPLENLHPNFFLEALVVHGLQPNDEYMVAADT